MPLDNFSGVQYADFSESEFEGEINRPWAEKAVTAAGAVLTVLFVSSVAVLMYLA